MGSPPTVTHMGSPPSDVDNFPPLTAAPSPDTVVIPPPTLPPTADTADFWQNLSMQPTDLPWPPSVITMQTISLAQDMLRLRVRRAVQVGTRHLLARVRAAGIQQPTVLVNDGPMDFLDQSWPSILADLAASESLSPGQLVEAVRGQTSADYRPNKALWPDDLKMLYCGYRHLDTMLTIASSGFRIPRTALLPQQPVAPQNHGSARKYDSTLMRLMREGQAAHQYVFLHKSVQQLWPRLLFYSPLGLVPKGKLPMSEIARVIQDLSFPVGRSVNDFTDKDLLPLIDWPRITNLAHRITDLHHLHPPGSRFLGMTGDVAQAYRHIRAHADDCASFGISIPGHDVVGMDMSAPFGWNGSPNMYCVFGDGITWLVRRESPASINPSLSCDTSNFWCYNYMDDFIIIELDDGQRLPCAELAWRLAMIATLGPEAMNNKKFQPWQSLFIALGLKWNVDNATVSMPEDKIAKAHDRVTTILKRKTATRSDLEKLLGSLRHVTSCVRPARAFYQTLHRVYRQFPTFGRRTLSRAALADLECFQAILNVAHLVDIPTSVFCAVSTPSITFQMDASDEAIAIIDVENRRYIQLQFNAFERFMINALATSNNRDQALAAVSRRYPDLTTVDEFSINVREHFAIVLAICLWGPLFASAVSTTHIGVLSDNTSAVSWSNSLSSPNKFSQHLNRALAVVCAQFRLEVSAQHIPGCANVVADAGSRPNTAHLRDLWQQSTHGWTAYHVPQALRNAYLEFSSSTLQRWVQAHGHDTSQPGRTGVTSELPAATVRGYHPPVSATLPNSRPGPCISLTDTLGPIGCPPYCKNCLDSPGFTSALAGTPSVSPKVTTPPSKALIASDSLPPEPKRLCRRACSLQVAHSSTSTANTTASCGGLRSWLGLCCGGVLNTCLSTAPCPDTSSA